MTIEQIRQDLKDIRYFYAMSDLFKSGAKLVPPLAVTQMIEKYNKVVANAPVKLYVLYVALYINNNSQITVADDWGYTADYVKKLNNKLCEFFKTEFNKETN